MRVKLLTIYAGPAGSYSAGSVVDFDEADAKPLIDGGYATQVEEPKRPRKEVVIESAIVEQDETTAFDPPRRRRKREE